MIEKITRGDVTITLNLNLDKSVDLRKKMIVDYPGIEDARREIYPSNYEKKRNLDTINDQFSLVESIRKFDEIYHRRMLGKKIKQLREEKSLTQQDLADLTDLKQANIARIESGKYSTGQDILSKIANALGKSLDII